MSGHWNNYTVVVIESTALDTFKAALDEASLPWERWIGSSLQQSKTGDYFQSHDWNQAATPALAAQVKTYLSTAGSTLGVHVITKDDLTAGELASKYGVCDPANWQAALERRTGIVFEFLDPVV